MKLTLETNLWEKVVEPNMKEYIKMQSRAFFSMLTDVKIKILEQNLVNGTITVDIQFIDNGLFRGESDNVVVFNRIKEYILKKYNKNSLVVWKTGRK